MVEAVIVLVNLLVCPRWFGQRILDAAASCVGLDTSLCSCTRHEDFIAERAVRGKAVYTSQMFAIPRSGV